MSVQIHSGCGERGRICLGGGEPLPLLLDPSSNPHSLNVSCQCPAGLNPARSRLGTKGPSQSVLLPQAQVHTLCLGPVAETSSKAALCPPDMPSCPPHLSRANTADPYDMDPPTHELPQTSPSPSCA